MNAEDQSARTDWWRHILSRYGCLVIVLAIAGAIGGCHLFVTKFTRTGWRALPEFREGLARDLIERGMLEGLDRGEVAALLGRPDQDDHWHTWYLGPGLTGVAFLHVRYDEAGRVREAWIELD